MQETITRRPVERPTPAIPAWRFWGPLALQVLIVLAVPAPKLMAYAAGTPVVLRTVPVDPVDLMRGRYTRLGYEIGQDEVMTRLPGWQPAFKRDGTTLYWTLAPGGGGEAWRAVAIADQYPASVPAGDVVLSGRMDGGHPTFGLEEYYVPEDVGDRLQAAMAGRRQADFAEVRVDRFGQGMLTGLVANHTHF